MRKVLIIEDDRPLCWLLKKIMHNKYEVIIMDNGMEAWSWLSDGNTPDVIISDIEMPSLDGIELLENLNNSGLFKNIPVIMLSGDENPEKRRKSMELGAFNYILKPFEPQLLLVEVGRAIASKKLNV